MIWRERNFKFDPNYEEEVSNLKRMGKFSTFSDKILTPSSMSRAEEAERRRQEQEELERQRHQQLAAKLEVTI